MNAVAMRGVGEFIVSRAGSINPANFPDELFDLYSIPAYDKGAPEKAPGREIGSSKQIVRPGDVLLSKIVPHIRRSWIVGAATENRLIASGEWIVFRSEEVNGSYLRHMLMSDEFHAQFMNTVAGVGGSLVRARPNYVARIKIPIPALEEQARIAGILDHIDSIRDTRRDSILILDDLANQIFSEMFGSNRSENEARLGDCLSFITSGGRGWAKYYADSGSRFIRSLDVRMNSIANSKPVYVQAPNNAEARRTLVREGDVLLTITGSLIGRVSPVPSGLDGAFVSQHVAILRPKREMINPAFLSFFLSLSFGGQIQISAMQYGQTKPGLNFRQISEFTIPIPEISAQDEFVNRMKRIEKIRSTKATHLAGLNALFGSLQYGAFLGDLSSSSVPHPLSID